jgi:hypothetical protein
MATESKKVELLGKEYLIPFPSMGQYGLIETLKSTLTDGEYGIMAKNAVGVTAQERALDQLDAYCTFFVLIPKFFSDNKFSNRSDIDMKSAMLMTKVYMKEFKPWFDKLMVELNDIEQDIDALNEIEKDTIDSSEQDN